MNATVACMFMWTHGWKSEPVRIELNMKIERIQPPRAFFHPDRFSLQNSIIEQYENIEDIAATAICDGKSPCFTKVLECKPASTKVPINWHSNSCWNLRLFGLKTSKIAAILFVGARFSGKKQGGGIAKVIGRTGKWTFHSILCHFLPFRENF